MSITYSNIKKDLPCEQLQELFMSAGWSDGTNTEYINLPFINSTMVVSAWDEEKLVGVVRVLSDQIIRSIIYDLVVLPQYHNQGIGKELIKQCIDHFPNSEWLIETTKDISGYYQKIGFEVIHDVFLSIPSIYQCKK